MIPFRCGTVLSLLQNLRRESGVQGGLLRWMALPIRGHWKAVNHDDMPGVQRMIGPPPETRFYMKNCLPAQNSFLVVFFLKNFFCLSFIYSGTFYPGSFFPVVITFAEAISKISILKQSDTDRHRYLTSHSLTHFGPIRSSDPSWKLSYRTWHQLWLITG